MSVGFCLTYQRRKQLCRHVGQKRVQRAPDEKVGGKQRALSPEDCEASRKTDIQSVWSIHSAKTMGQSDR